VGVGTAEAVGMGDGVEETTGVGVMMMRPNGVGVGEAETSPVTRMSSRHTP
jgi:hypothetical protein